MIPHNSPLGIIFKTRNTIQNSLSADLYYFGDGLGDYLSMSIFKAVKEIIKLFLNNLFSDLPHFCVDKPNDIHAISKS